MTEIKVLTVLYSVVVLWIVLNVRTTYKYHVCTILSHSDQARCRFLESAEPTMR
jgi:hypothetical protein